MRLVSTEESERPGEWLRRFQENRRLYRTLLEDAGSLAVAAYRLALARARTQPVPTGVPTLTEIEVAAREIARRVDAGMRVPSGAMLLADCELMGVPVIAPLAAHDAA